ncbi:alpha/beta hydrolase [Alloscardovia omnicolens]|uniref:alpha/beta hydrolase n=1 Tax=Alloscardovia omnicolens TaxID=419015 RepID=UPI003A718E89
MSDTQHTQKVYTRMHQRFNSRVSALYASVIIAASVIGICDVIRYALFGRLWPVVTVFLVHGIVVLLSAIAAQTRCPLVLLLNVALTGTCGFIMTHPETTIFNADMYLQAGIALLGCIGICVVQAVTHTPMRKPRMGAIIALLAICLAWIVVWQGGIIVNNRQTSAEPTIWSVPNTFEQASSEPGTVEKISYSTKAYATDKRQVTKSAYVYLPHNYDASKKYNILYLMHGTGDNEAYWLITHPENKIMVDRMIERAIIPDMIIVTPTFYVENDKLNSLDDLTYSFKDELRNDLMPYVESRYSTYSDGVTAQDFVHSRGHRAFAGLSRGAVTTLHSAFTGSLDYFSWFGTFSGSRTSQAQFRNALQSAQFKKLPINYYYVASGTFDFALPQQLKDYRSLLEIEPRVRAGKNSRFDIFPMRWHSAGNWHIALYNFLPHIFTE